MEKEIINLELTPKNSMFDCLVDGIYQFFKNFVPFLKMLLPILWISLSSILLSLATTGTCFCILFKNVFLICLSLCFLVFSIVVFCYAFWQYLLGLIAVCYLAKDIYENKPIQTTKDYYSYVEAHSANYIKYLLLVAFVIIIWFFMFFGLILPICFPDSNIAIKILCSLSLILFSLLSVPFVIGLSLSQFFFAFQDKTKPLSLINKAILTTFKKFFPVLGFTILLNIFIGLVGLIPIVNIFFVIITQYFISFVTTRYYFELIKN